MPIFVPGLRDRHNRPQRNTARTVVVVLSLTAMVDMFTVLVVFLLQNYRVTGEAIEIPDQVALPKAAATKELKPAHVVIIDKQSVYLDKDIVATFLQVKEQQDWMIEPLALKLQEEFRKSAEKRAATGLNTLKTAVETARQGDTAPAPENDKRITVQADKEVDFLTVKKVLYTLTEVGADEINFAVIKDESVPVAE